MLGFIFTNIFKNKLLWSVTSTLGLLLLHLWFFTIAGKGFTLQNGTTFVGYLPHFALSRKEKMLKQIQQSGHDRCQPYCRKTLGGQTKVHVHFK